MTAVGNLAILEKEEPQTKDKDGSDDEGNLMQITIAATNNGFVVTESIDEGLTTVSKMVYLFDGHPSVGPRAMIQDLIDLLGIADKVKIVR